MNVLDLCEPLFQYICRLNRSARKGVTVEHDRTRGEIKALFDDLRAKAAARPDLLDQFKKVKRPLVYFVDSTIMESRLPFAPSWRELAADRQVLDDDEPPGLAGDEHFFHLLDAALAENSPSAAERLTVFYTCLGLGFTGWYAGQPEHLRKKMFEISSRLRGVLDPDPHARLCPQAYQHTNSADLGQPLGQSLAGIGIALLGFLIVLAAANLYLYRASSTNLREALQRIVQEFAPPVLPTDAAAASPPAEKAKP